MNESKKEGVSQESKEGLLSSSLEGPSALETWWFRNFIPLGDGVKITLTGPKSWIIRVLGPRGDQKTFDATTKGDGPSDRRGGPGCPNVDNWRESKWSNVHHKEREPSQESDCGDTQNSLH